MQPDWKLSGAFTAISDEGVRKRASTILLGDAELLSASTSS
jgi:hypothetical protein